MARFAAGDTRATYILCPEPPSNWRVEKEAKQGLLEELARERATRAAAGDYRSTYISCPRTPCELEGIASVVI